MLNLASITGVSLELTNIGNNAELNSIDHLISQLVDNRRNYCSFAFNLLINYRIIIGIES